MPYAAEARGCPYRARLLASRPARNRCGSSPAQSWEDSVDRRSFVFGSAAAAAALKASFAQDAAYPTHAIVMINPFPPGGAADVVGRPLAAVIEPRGQKPAVVGTTGGAAGAAGARLVANGKPAA